MNIKNSLYIGLGGAGIKAMAHTKKMFEDVFGQGCIPPQIGFVAIDFDYASVRDQSLPTRIGEDFVAMPDSGDLRQVYESIRGKGLLRWFSPEDAVWLPRHIGDSARQSRPVGRFMTEYAMPHISRKIDSVFRRVANSVNVNFQGFHVDVHIAMSLAGGTGAGSFINVAQHIRERYSHHARIIGYGVLHNVFRAMDRGVVATPRVSLNSYASLLDLDYFQSASQTNPVKFEVNGVTKTIIEPLFDDFYLFDNKIGEGKVISDVNVICRTIGNTMYLSGCDVGVALRRMFATVSWKYGAFDWGNKLGWVQSAGVCQVVYDGEHLAEIYSHKAKLELLRQFTMWTASDCLADWMELVGIRDKECRNVLIDRILFPAEVSTAALTVLDVNDNYELTCLKVREYIDSFSKCIADYPWTPIRAEVTASLRTKVAEILPETGGVKSVDYFLRGLNDVCSESIDEVQKEIRHLHKRAERLETDLDDVLGRYGAYLRRVFILQGGKQNRLDEIADISLEIAKHKLEATRREVAIDILRNLKYECDSWISKVRELQMTINSLELKYSRAELYSGHDSIFEYDLSYCDWSCFSLKEGEVSLPDFTATLQKPVWELWECELDDALTRFTSDLPRCHEYRNRLISDVVANLPEDEYNRMKHAVLRMGTTLLKVDDRGLADRFYRTPSMNMVRLCCVTSYQDIPRISQDPVFGHPDVQFVFADSVAEQLKQRIMFWRVDSAIIPYCVDAFSGYELKEYERHITYWLRGGRTYNPHIDLHIFEDMVQKGFVLKPEDEICLKVKELLKGYHFQMGTCSDEVSVGLWLPEFNSENVTLFCDTLLQAEESESFIVLVTRTRDLNSIKYQTLNEQSSGFRVYDIVQGIGDDALSAIILKASSEYLVEGLEIPSRDTLGQGSVVTVPCRNYDSRYILNFSVGGEFELDICYLHHDEVLKCLFSKSFSSK